MEFIMFILSQQIVNMVIVLSVIIVGIALTAPIVYNLIKKRG